MVISDDNRQYPVKPEEIESLEDSKYSNYQESGVDSENPQALSIKQNALYTDSKK